MITFPASSSIRFASGCVFSQRVFLFPSQTFLWFVTQSFLPNGESLRLISYKNLTSGWLSESASTQSLNLRIYFHWHRCCLDSLPTRCFVIAPCRSQLIGSCSLLLLQSVTKTVEKVYKETDFGISRRFQKGSAKCFNTFNGSDSLHSLPFCGVSRNAPHGEFLDPLRDIPTKRLSKYLMNKEVFIHGSYTYTYTYIQSLYAVWCSMRSQTVVSNVYNGLLISNLL